MAVSPTTSFDLKALRRGFEEWDIEGLLALLDDDVEQIQVDRDNPPSQPLVRRGKDVYRGMFEHCAAAGVKATVERGLAGPGRASATVTCEFPGGRKVVANSTYELRNGLIVREHTVACGDS